MDKTNKEKLYETISEVIETSKGNIDEMAREIVELARQNAKTYGELLEGIRFAEEQEIFVEPDTYRKDLIKTLFNRCREMVDQERNDLPLTNRSEDPSDSDQPGAAELTQAMVKFVIENLKAENPKIARILVTELDFKKQNFEIEVHGTSMTTDEILKAGIYRRTKSF
ncbi:hypothetical protein [Tindallia californiensis]|uniref:Uncharacterized protein n=1 Tax=Tindallia californiensis TaxID=159292 RepID=A0A1H3R1N4_9FIRM|nr:hypothetical protein [Tindallia californiensis]SDZ18859.1 hypothetical protein SAMN05192546_11150 [Tindallia californiensis]